MNADIIFTGHAAHSARPWLGENAVTKAGAWLAAMHERMPDRVPVTLMTGFGIIMSIRSAKRFLA